MSGAKGLTDTDGDRGTVVAATNDWVAAAMGTSVVDGRFPSNLVVVGSLSILVILF